MKRLFLAAALLCAGLAHAANVNLCTYAGVDPTGATDSRAALVSALASVAGTTNVLTVNCPVKLTMGSTAANTMMLSSDTTVQFGTAGLFIVDNLMIPLFVIDGQTNVNFYSAKIKVIADVGDFVASMLLAAAEVYGGAVNDTVIKPWMAAHLGVTFGSYSSIWEGPTNAAALFWIKGAATNINLTGAGSTIYVPSGVLAAHFAPTLICMGPDWKTGATAAATPTTANSTVPDHVTITDWTFDGAYMGIVGTATNLTISNISSFRYGDLQDSSGNYQGGNGPWFAPPHLIYVITGGQANYLASFTISNVRDYGLFTGAATRRAGLGSGTLLAFKLEGNNSTAANLTSLRPDGCADIVSYGTGGGMTITNLYCVMNSAVATSDASAIWGIRFPGPVGPYVNLTMNHVRVIDTATSPQSFLLKGMTGANSNINFSDVNLYQHAVVGSFPSFSGTGISIGVTATYDTCSGGRPAGGTNDPGTVAGCGSISAAPYPTINSVAATNWTVTNNALCTGLTTGFWWEIGNGSAVLASGARSGSSSYTASTNMSIASASKIIFGTYVTQVRGGASNLTSSDVNFLHQESGYTNAPDSCGSATTIATCLAQTQVSNCAGATVGAAGFAANSFGAQCPADIGVFHYSGSNFNVEAYVNLPSGFYNAGLSLLASDVNTELGLTSPNTLTYTGPNLAGDVYANAQTIRVVLQKIVANTLFMHDALGTSTVCTLPAGNYTSQIVGGVTGPSSCPATGSPLPEALQYSIAHWVESDPAVHGDGAFSSAGAFGFLPWIGADKAYYGIIARQDAPGSGDASLKCGALMRRAWYTGINQSGSIPTP